MDISTTAPPPRIARLLGALTGLLAGAAALATSEAVSAFLDGVTSPFLAVGNRAVDQAPRPLKELAIETFGTADKPVLIGGVLVTVAALVMVAGAWSVSRPRVLPVAVLVLGAVAGAASVTDRSASAGVLLRLVPVAVLVGVGLAASLWLLGRLRAPERATGQSAPSAAQAGPTTGSTTGPTPGPTNGPAPGRRGFLLAALTVGGLAAVGGVVARAYGGLAATASRAGITLPGAARPAPPLAEGATLEVEGITPHVTANRDFYRVDTALRIPDVPVDTWRLRIHGLVDREVELTYDDLLARDLVERRITLTCVSNPVGGDYVGNATWLGVPIRELLQEAGVQDGADAVRSTSADDWTAGTPLAHLLDPEHEALLAVGMNGEPLPLDHGFPARMVVPGLYGYVSATKWLVDLEVTRFADFEAYWTTRGYAAEAPIKTSSRIDVPRSFARVPAGPVPVAGVAWSQTRGIEQVEVRVDRGDWQQARLAEQDNLDTWRQWVWEWDATPGTHQLEVRATDGTGYTQTSRRAPIAPDGSTGWNSVSVTVV